MILILSQIVDSSILFSLANSVYLTYEILLVIPIHYIITISFMPVYVKLHFPSFSTVTCKILEFLIRQHDRFKQRAPVITVKKSKVRISRNITEQVCKSITTDYGPRRYCELIFYQYAHWKFFSGKVSENISTVVLILDSFLIVIRYRVS